MKERLSRPIRPNCIGFALHMLGLIRKETFIEPLDYRDLLPWFVVVKDIDEAEAVVFTRLIEENIRLVWHMAMVDPQDRMYIIQRRETGAEINRELLKDVRSTYPLDKGYFMICLKRSFTADC